MNKSFLHTKCPSDSNLHGGIIPSVLTEQSRIITEKTASPCSILDNSLDGMQMQAPGRVGQVEMELGSGPS